MSSTYRRFLASPSAAALNANASMQYLTTLTTFTGPEAILKHLTTLQKQVTKKKEEPLTLVEGDNVIALELDTGIEFQTSGGVYVPGIDDNFLSDRTVFLPIMHIVNFDAEGKIFRVRIQWDQGALLKQLDIIGKTGRNWPIKDSREQLAMIQSSLKLDAGAAASGHNDLALRNRGNSTNVMRDPHATLHMTSSREEIEAEVAARIVSPYGGKRPQQRSFTDILGDEPVGPDSPGAERQRAMSPAKQGQGKNYQPMRLFDRDEDHIDEDTPKGKAPNQGIRPHPSKYNHFDIADGSDPHAAQPQRPSARPKSVHGSQWNFEDFTTPAKVKPGRTTRGETTRHWDTDREAMEPTPAQPAGKARRDADTHFELQDDGEKVVHPGRANTRPRGSTHNENLGLYKNKLFDEGETGETPPSNALSNITNLKDRGKDFEAHFAMTDDSPAHRQTNQPLPEGRQKAVRMMDPNWSNYDESPSAPNTTFQKGSKARPTDTANFDEQRINIAGDGMGGRKGTNRDWLYGDSSGEVEPAPKPRGGQRPAESKASKDFWDF